METGKPKMVEFAQLAIAFVALVVTTSSMEAVWYLGLAKDTYATQIGPLMNAQFDVFVAALFYLCYSLGATIFAVRPALLARSWRHAAGFGALYGFFCFSAHNLTDLADVKGYTAQIALIDMCWGTCMTALACLLSYAIALRARQRT
ncbi:Integral membrane protein [Burkholderiales bacterium]|nr:Integral membrane protein [Burkholderiales bacterium]